MKDYEIKLNNLLIQQRGYCKSCGKKLKRSEKIDLAHKLKASRGKSGNYELFGELIIDHELNLAATHSGNCNDAQNCSRAANPVKATEILITIIHQLLLNDPLVFTYTQLNKAFDNMKKIGKCKDITDPSIVKDLEILENFFMHWNEI